MPTIKSLPLREVRAALVDKMIDFLTQGVSMVVCGDELLYGFVTHALFYSYLPEGPFGLQHLDLCPAQEHPPRVGEKEGEKKWRDR